MNRIRAFPSNSPLARFNTGLQILRQKVDEWNSVAHKLNNFKELEYEIAELIQKWMRMELQCWRESLNQSLEGIKNKAHRYWFFLYNLIHEFLAGCAESESESLLVDFKEVEKRFASDEVAEEQTTIKGKISIDAITRVLRQFIESSNYAEFSIRMNLLKSFENYLQRMSTTEKAKRLVKIMHNLHLYFSQFSNSVQEFIDFARKPVEKKLKDFVKIESFNKDLSYFSMRSNIQRVHRHLHKILKEFELEATKKIGDLFIYKDSAGEFNEFKSSTKIPVFAVEKFISSLEVSGGQTDVSYPEILQNISKYFNNSKKIIKKSIEASQYPVLVDILQDEMDKELETCLHLRSLEVDRSQPRNKQKSQAKSILNQKRKALTDFFKTLTAMGVSYKTGVLTSSLTAELTSLEIEKFSLDSAAEGDHQVLSICQKLDLYFNKSVLKMKLLGSAMLMPRPDMDHAFLERMKGFAVDLFTLVQDQRKHLGENVNEIEKFRGFIKEIEDLEASEASTNAINFKIEAKKIEIIKSSFIEVAEILEQFKILMKCSPEDYENRHMVTESTNNTFTQKSSVYSKIIVSAEEILVEARREITDIASSRFPSNVSQTFENFKSTVKKLGELKELFVVGKSYSIYGQPICDLHKSLKTRISQIETTHEFTSADLDTEIENFIHTLLISIQNIFKKYETIESTTIEEIIPNHLKEKLHQDLANDFNLLNLPKINVKLQNILNNVFTSTSPRAVHQITKILPITKQFRLLTDYFLIQQLSSHKLSVKMLSIMLSVFLELSTKGFCVPQDLLSDEEQKEEKDTKTGDGFGFEDGTGDKDVSDKLESEDQLDEARKPEDYDNKNDQQDKDCKEEEKGIDMSDDFDGKMQDVDKNEDSDNEANEDENEELDKEMGETEEGADKLDVQIWGDDEEKQPEEEENEKGEETGQGSGDKDDQHNDMDTDKNQAEGQEEEGLDAADAGEENKQKQKKDIEHMEEQGEEEDQVNPYHNELEEPPQPEDMNLDEDFNLDNEDKEANENPEENPFDIDKMKENMETSEQQEENDEDPAGEEENPEKKDEADGSDSEDGDDPEKPDPEQDKNEEQENPENPDQSEETPQVPDNIPEEEKSEDPKTQNPAEDFHESKDKKSKEQDIQAMPNQQQTGSNDDVQVEAADETAKQENDIDEQDTGEDRDGIGQAENEESKSGHQGVADTKETKSKRNQQKDRQQQKRKMGNTDEERTLGEVDKMEKKSLKTVDKLDRKEQEGGSDQEMDDEEHEEYQHVKDAKKSDKTTLDNATDEQSKQIQHNERPNEDEDEEMEACEELPEQDQEEDPEMLDKDIEKLESSKFDKKSDKPAKEGQDRMDRKEEIEIDGEQVTTFNVPRGDDTSAHCQMDIVNDVSVPEEATATELFEMRKMVESEVTSQKIVNPGAGEMEKWQEVSNRMQNNARDLCEQLRLILEPTKCTRLKGDYRTGRRINMKKIIPYIASQFRKDKIWLRRTKAAHRDYKITIAVDDSKSMDHNNSKNLTLQAISLVSQALTLLESGKLCVMSFGEMPKILLKYNEQFDGPKMVKSLNFDQNQSKIAELLNFSRTMNQEDPSSDNGIFEHLLIVLSDGRNIFSEGDKKVRNAVKMARLQRMFIVYIIIDNPDNKHSILDIKVPQFSADKKTLTMHSYLDTFPFPYYVIVRDLNQLPLVLSDGLRQWFELVNSE